MNVDLRYRDPNLTRKILEPYILGAVVAPLFFAGKVELGVVSQSFGAFNHILNDFSIIANQVTAASISRT